MRLFVENDRIIEQIEEEHGEFLIILYYKKNVNAIDHGLGIWVLSVIIPGYYIRTILSSKVTL